MRPKKTDIERFEAKVDRSGGPDACHPWTGGYGQYGHPCFYLGKNRTASSRRWLWEHLNGPLPKTRWVTPRCENLSCVNPNHLTLRSAKDDVSRFWEKVEKSGGCWVWTGRLQKGYPIFHINTHPTLAHRFSYELHYGKIEGHVPGHPELEICVCHKCDNPKCVRPDHLFLGNDKTNHDDKVRKGRHAHGPALSAAVRRGHEQRRMKLAVGAPSQNEGGDT